MILYPRQTQVTDRREKANRQIDHFRRQGKLGERLVYITRKRLLLRHGSQGRIRSHDGIDSLEEETPSTKFQIGMKLW